MDDATLELCADNCAGFVEVAHDLSLSCAAAYASLIECLADAGCDAQVDWARDPSVSPVCREHADALAQTCAELSFSFVPAP